MTDQSCPFCEIASSSEDDRIVLENTAGIVIRDKFPVTRGHTLIVPKRHTGSFFDLASGERDALLDLLDRAKLDIDEEFRPDGYNIGINDGPAAGQTVPHLHIHLIPRYQSDDSDPRGGVRWIIPDKADYWSEQ